MSLQIFLVGFSAFVVLLIVLLWRRTGVYHAPDINGYNVFITGGSSGIGLALARLFYEAGASVTLIARSMSRLHEARETLLANCDDRDRIHLVSLDLCGSYSIIERDLSAHLALVGKSLFVGFLCYRRVSKAVLFTYQHSNLDCKLDYIPCHSIFIGCLDVYTMELPYTVTRETHCTT